MCFGSAFIASNSSAQFKVRKVFLTQHPNFEISIGIAPLDLSRVKTQTSKDESAQTNETEVEEETI